jgi:hypothetical protein
MSDRSNAALRRLALALGLVLAVGAVTQAAPLPLSKEEQAKVDEAIARGVRYLKSNLHTQRSGYSAMASAGWSLLHAWALLECGVPANSPGLQKIAQGLRRNHRTLWNTYDLALAVIFLDRLGDPQDEHLIRSLALRLIAGQSYNGGWCYRCPSISAENQKALVAALDALQGQKGERPGQRANKEPASEAEVPAALKVLSIFQKPEDLFAPKRTERDELTHGHRSNDVLYVGPTDNSNTQFATLALWAARRHGVVVDPTVRLLVQRFERTQNADGSWSYRYREGGEVVTGDQSVERCNTSAGLLALAIGRCDDPSASEKVQNGREHRIVQGLSFLSKQIAFDRHVQRNPYFLWSVERIGTMYNLPLVGEVDWYRWGAEIFLANQLDNGSWSFRQEAGWLSGDVRGTEPTCTAFALLFLKRVHVAKDLTAKLPWKEGELNNRVLAELGVTKPPIGTAASPGSHKP